MWKSTDRAVKALGRNGLVVERDGNIVRVRAARSTHGPTSEVLLPKDHPLDGKALKQLASFASVTHPSGGEVRRALATPDFHPGACVPVGCVLATSPDLVVPQAIGTDINCGMRLHVAEVSLDRFLARRDEWVEKIKGDLLLGTRNLPMTIPQVRAMFRGGPLAWLEAVRANPLGMLARADHAELEDELERSFGLGSVDGDPRYAPQEMMPGDRDIVRDCFLGTIGGGNHFVEVQVVEEVLDGRWAFAWGVRRNQLAFMVHSGSRRVGVVIGGTWTDHARESWPSGTPHPEHGIFPLHGESAHSYMVAMNTAANYAAVNRLLLAEMVRDRLREVFSRQLAVPLVYDVPHNIVTEENGSFVHRKGATPARQGQPVLIPGSMGQSSFLMVGQGNPRFLQSASHGAGRKASRGRMHHMARRGEDIGLSGVECITLKQERIIQEAPAAYKEVGPVVEVQAEAGIATPVARLRPIMTFKA